MDERRRRNGIQVVKGWSSDAAAAIRAMEKPKFLSDGRPLAVSGREMMRFE